MEPLARLPIFHDLAGKRVVLAGGGPPAAWKAELLAACGAEVEVFARAVSEELAEVAADPPAGAIRLHPRVWEPTDLAGAALAVADAHDDAEAAAFRDAARAAGAPVNVIDRPAFCDFAFGAVVNRSPLVVGISTDGAAPVFGQAVRTKIEALLPRGFKAWAEAARDWRPAVTALALSFARRRAFWEAFTARALAEPERPPTLPERDALLARAREEAGRPEVGSVALVGAGPGDPELLTLRAVRAMQSAEVILHDDLVPAEVLALARREARRISVGKTGHGPSCRQEEVDALMVALAREGRRVVRLKSGDPGVFGRGGEELAACRAAGLAVEVVPGVTAAQGAAAALGVSLTHRDHARRLQYVTGHGRDGRLPADLDMTALADPRATTAVYMPLRTLPGLVERLLAAGLDGATPAVAVANATRGDARELRAGLGELPGRLAAERAVGAWPEGPTLVLYGRAMGEASAAAVEEAAAALAAE